MVYKGVTGKTRDLRIAWHEIPRIYSECTRVYYVTTGGKIMRRASTYLLAMMCMLVLMVAPQAFALNYTEINFPGSTATNPTAINDSGQIAGWYADANSEHGFLWDNGTSTAIDGPARLNYSRRRDQ